MPSWFATLSSTSSWSNAAPLQSRRAPHRKPGFLAWFVVEPLHRVTEPPRQNQDFSIVAGVLESLSCTSVRGFNVRDARDDGDSDRRRSGYRPPTTDAIVKQSRRHRARGPC